MLLSGCLSFPDHNSHNPLPNEGAETTLSLLTFNILSSFDLGNFFAGYPPWIERKPEVLRTLVASDADLMSIQECSPGQLREMQSALSDTYTILSNVNLTPDAILLFKRDRFSLLEQGHWALENPYTGNRRIAIWAKLEENTSGRKFMMVSSHLDGKSLKNKEARLLKEKLQPEQAYGAPLFLMGDFNIAPDEDAYATLIADDWKDSFPTGIPDMPTFPRKHLDRRIDHVFHFGNQVEVLKWELVGRQASLISDHMPVRVHVRILGSTP